MKKRTISVHFVFNKYDGMNVFAFSLQSREFGTYTSKIYLANCPTWFVPYYCVAQVTMLLMRYEGKFDHIHFYIGDQQNEGLLVSAIKKNPIKDHWKEDTKKYISMYHNTMYPFAKQMKKHKIGFTVSKGC